LEARLSASDLSPTSPVSRLFRTMLEKKSNLCVAADLCSLAEIRDLVEKIGDKICCLKLHFDIVRVLSMFFVV
jgi:orotidine-5'-phosphate decarboxylase